MIGYVTLGSNDVPRAGTFYDGVLGELNAKRQIDAEGFIAWSQSAGTPMLSVIKPFDESPARVGNGVMVALTVTTRDEVASVHAKALSLGAADEGAPGLRGESFYGAYFRDLDGNKLVVYTADSFG
jgi:predicted lactoylglutathione lyase